MRRRIELIGNSTAMERIRGLMNYTRGEKDSSLVSGILSGLASIQLLFAPGIAAKKYRGSLDGDTASKGEDPWRAVGRCGNDSEI